MVVVFRAFFAVVVGISQTITVLPVVVMKKVLSNVTNVLGASVQSTVNVVRLTEADVIVGIVK